ncbi:MAG: hypothetical protein V4501_08130 [Pseudomonadota bacterium]
MRTEVAGGSSRYAMEWDRGFQKFNVTLVLDKLKFSVWTAFFHHVIKKGAYTFDMPLDSGFGTSLHAVNMMPGSYSATRTQGLAMIVSFVVETESEAYELSATEGAGLVDIYNTYGASTPDLLDRLAQFANVDSLVLDF